MPGLPFDDVRGVIRNQQGRVIDDAGHVLRGVYTSGWIKRGCRGIIGSNRKCARETVAQLLDDWASGRLAGPALNKAAVLAAVRARQPDALSPGDRSEEHTSQLPSLIRSSYAVFCL